jgi:hypothetical protein
MFDELYPVPARTEERNRRIAGHEVGHAVAIRLLGNFVHLITIIPNENFEGRVVRSGPTSEQAFADEQDQTAEILSVCDRLAAMQLELGSTRISDAEAIVRCQNSIVELVAGKVAEDILFPDQPSLGGLSDGIGLTHSRGSRSHLKLSRLSRH